MNKLTRHQRKQIVWMAVALQLLMALVGFAVGYYHASHDKRTLGAVGALAGMIIFDILVWVVVIPVALRLRRKQDGAPPTHPERSMAPSKPVLNLLDVGLLALAICAAAASKASLARHSTVGAFLLVVLALAFMATAFIRGVLKLSRRPHEHR